MHTCYYSGVVRRANGSSRGHSCSKSCHASSDHELPRSPASQRDSLHIPLLEISPLYPQPQPPWICLQPLQQLQIHQGLHHHESEVVALPFLALRSLPSGEMFILWLGGKSYSWKCLLSYFVLFLALLNAYLFCIGLYRMHVLADSRQ